MKTWVSSIGFSFLLLQGCHAQSLADVALLMYEASVNSETFNMDGHEVWYDGTKISQTQDGPVVTGPLRIRLASSNMHDHVIRPTGAELTFDVRTTGRVTDPSTCEVTATSKPTGASVADFSKPLVFGRDVDRRVLEGSRTTTYYLKNIDLHSSLYSRGRVGDFRPERVEVSLKGDDLIVCTTTHMPGDKDLRYCDAHIHLFFTNEAQARSFITTFRTAYDESGCGSK